jgi:hypothetical protein
MLSDGPSDGRVQAHREGRQMRARLGHPRPPSAGALLITTTTLAWYRAFPLREQAL